MLAAAFADLGYSLYRVYTSLSAIEGDFQAISRFVANSNLNAAVDANHSAKLHSQEALRYLDHPAPAVLSSLPIDDLHALRALAKATRQATEAGGRLLPVLARRGLVGEDSIYEDGQVQLDKLRSFGSPLEQAVAGLRQAEAQLSDDLDPFLGRLNEGLDKARVRVQDTVATLDRAAGLVDVLPSFLGGDEERRYLLAFQALGEARATGGLVGFFGELSVDNGRVRLVRIAPIREISIDTDPPVEAPRWFEKNYGPQQALRQVQQANVSPNFPVVAGVLLRMYERSVGGSLDGLIAMDPIALSELMAAMEPIETPNYPAVSADNVVELVLHDSYLELEDRQQDAFLSSLIDGFWQRLKAGDVDSEEFIKGLTSSASRGHVKVFSKRAEEQSTFAELGIHGGIPDDHPSQMVFHNNYGPNKVDYFLRRRVATRVELDQSGVANVSVTVVLNNTAPPGPASPLLGFESEGTPPGVNRMLLNFLAPRGADIGELEVDGEPQVSFGYSDDRFPIAGGLVTIPARESVSVRFRYRVPVEITRDGTFSFSLIGQTAAIPEQYSLLIFPPYGYRILTPGQQTLSSYTSRGVLEGTRTFDLRLVSGG